MASCKKCRQEREDTDFPEFKAGKRRKTCKYCRRASTSYRRRNWLRKYNITPEDYCRMVDEQDNRCAICNRLPNKYVLAVDHNHETGQVRALLCNPCNAALGLFNEDVDRLAAAIAYLREHSNR